MTPLHLTGPAKSIEAALLAMAPEVASYRPSVKLQMERYQMMALYVLAKRHNREDARFLEIGTGHGGSAFMLSRGAPLARILSLTTSQAEIKVAQSFWTQTRCGATAICMASWDLLPLEQPEFDLIFIDGDHNQIARDLPWFNQLRRGGLLLCHDYSPADSRSPSPVVYAALQEMADFKLMRPFDVLLFDDERIGMAGFYRRDGEAV